MAELQVDIYNRKRNKTYRIKKFIEYKVDLDLETEADGFDIVFPNVGGAFTGLVNRFDRIDIKLNGHNLLYGIVDRVEILSSSNEDMITITGRDNACILLDNDALPETIQNVNPKNYISKKCGEYGIKYKPLMNVSSTKQLIIGTGESELSVIGNLLSVDKQRLWFIYDTLYSGMWSTAAKSSGTFTRGKTGVKGVNVESIKFIEDGKDTKSEVKIYGSMDDNSEKVVGTAHNTYMEKNNIIRRSVKRSSNNDSSTKYSASALDDVRDSFRDNTSIEIQVYTHDNFFLPNTTARVVDKRLDIDGTFFIKSVSYTKSIDGGEAATIIMVPDDPTFDVIWKNQ